MGESLGSDFVDLARLRRPDEDPGCEWLPVSSSRAGVSMEAIGILVTGGRDGRDSRAGSSTAAAGGGGG